MGGSGVSVGGAIVAVGGGAVVASVGGAWVGVEQAVMMMSIIKNKGMFFIFSFCKKQIFIGE